MFRERMEAEVEAIIGAYVAALHDAEADHERRDAGGRSAVGSSVYLADPRHVPGGMSFSFSARSPESIIQVGSSLLMVMSNDPTFSNVRNRMVTLPAGKAIRVTSTVTKDGGTYSDVKFGFAHHGRAYIVTFMGLPSLMADHAAQIDAAARSVRFVR